MNDKWYKEKTSCLAETESQAWKYDINVNLDQKIDAEYLFELFQFLQAREHDVFTCLLNLSCQEHFIKDSIYLVLEVSWCSQDIK